ncbi:hypothetical protein SEA_SKOG_83 [Gordonia phage Skog]|uniref:Uncharacterized protein n=1 Tax=Gordonia phage Skog TaxID=2704033 RepID=A0A6G6XK58_9CAUD|nr:hypothetical protein KHQ85_gp083 [Gordonia phage Skog]QIG58235.1 hypothetical protein SEA_SKOG_83 [Gordonia phage Skog]
MTDQDTTKMWLDGKRVVFRDDKGRYHSFKLEDGSHEQTFSHSAFRDGWTPLVPRLQTLTVYRESDKMPEPDRENLLHNDFVRDWFGLFSDEELGYRPLPDSPPMNDIRIREIEHRGEMVREQVLDLIEKIDVQHQRDERIRKATEAFWDKKVDKTGEGNYFNEQSKLTQDRLISSMKFAFEAAGVALP